MTYICIFTSITVHIYLIKNDKQRNTEATTVVASGGENVFVSLRNVALKLIGRSLTDAVDSGAHLVKR